MGTDGTGGAGGTGDATSWAEVVRLRTLPAAVAPVVLGSGVAAALGTASPPRCLLAAGVGLALQIGSNLANDYSDGVRGTDNERTGPPRLTASGQVDPRSVKYAALGCFVLAGVLGLVLVALASQWWLLGVGAAAVAAAWFYTGGSRPYGYMGLGEVFVFVFFGLVATAGTVYVQGGSVPGWVWLAACGIGLIACSLLMVNNLRDIATDPRHGKMTLAVRLGERGARRAFVAMVCASVALAVAAVLWARADLSRSGEADTSGGSVWVLLAAVTVLAVVLGAMAARALRPVVGGARGRALVPALRDAGLYELAYGVTLALALVLVAA
ncbi:1,4-dihydroxy-2-naphthoate polyprenyltransferase [Actinomyces lilanjuaniae]|uniref:1,4-dihydroxy-2-naphthoate octaprenyltransferase n=1 Tax=Actinomyces lilanjuaniae TaxID=2321394 RepID=A0ABM6Z6H9_9ACTO|nr:1,4-dihydroxy-2-naphthoate polyprenyltransferase [Actinomyces lilanjuaniae]AYD90967.1 1,4-dihydroxy-2-naphthoate polyprenyltransferase [Actinomyces lilanjuaniae]